MPVLQYLKEDTIKALKKKHEELYCRAKLQGRQFWSMDDTLKELVENYG